MDFFDTNAGRIFGISTLAVLAVILSSIIVHLVAFSDPGQLVALLLFTYPLIALLIGLAGGFAGLKLWVTAAITLVLFSGATLLLFNNSALVYVPVYLAVTLVGFGAVALVRWLYRPR